MLAGFCKRDITPPLQSMEVFGLGYWYERAVRFRGVRDPLFVRALAMGEDAACQIIISVDATFDSFGFIERAVPRIASELGLPGKNIFITCTHTHSTPLIYRNNTERGYEYGAYVTERIATAAVDAFRKREPVTVSICCGQVSEVLYNRRPLLKNGQIAELHVPLDPRVVADPGPVDDMLSLVRFCRRNGELLGAVCHFGIHGVAIQCSDLISSDCMGRAIQQAEAQLGARSSRGESSDGAVILHLNAPCGDIDPIVMGDAAALDTMTGRLFSGIQQVNASEEYPVCAAPQKSISGLFRARRRATRLPNILLNEEHRIANSVQSDDLRHHSGPGYELFLIEEEQAVWAMPQELDIPYQILRTGDLVWVGIGGEIFTSFGMRLKSFSQKCFILPVGITGHSQGYLPPESAFSRGGYEVACARWCPIAPGETEQLFARIEQDLSAVLTARAG